MVREHAEARKQGGNRAETGRDSRLHSERQRRMAAAFRAVRTTPGRGCAPSTWGTLRSGPAGLELFFACSVSGQDRSISPLPEGACSVFRFPPTPFPSGVRSGFWRSAEPVSGRWDRLAHGMCPFQRRAGHGMAGPYVKLNQTDFRGRTNRGPADGVKARLREEERPGEACPEKKAFVSFH